MYGSPTVDIESTTKYIALQQSLAYMFQDQEQIGGAMALTC